MYHHQAHTSPLTSHHTYHTHHTHHTLTHSHTPHTHTHHTLTQEVEFTPTTTVQEFLSQLSLDVGMPDTTTTGFALVSDWPGVEEDACYYLFPESKLCDVISMWTDLLEQLNHIRMHNQRRTISLSYRNRWTIVYYNIQQCSICSVPQYAVVYRSIP